MTEMQKLVEQYLAKRARVLPRLTAFTDRRQPYLIVQSAPLDVYTRCNTVQEVCEENLKFFERQLDVESDWLPYLEPWMGTGVYANAFGCDYVWREGESPAVHYRYHHLEDAAAAPLPEIADSPIMQRILECIACLREQTGDQLPIALTDTQSANDTASLVLDACEVFAGAYEAPESLHLFMGRINQLIIAFSRRQIEAIGTAPLARPGHIMVSDPTWSGLSISDDNLAVVSPEVGREFCLRYDQELADAFGGLAIHSCGRWQHLMPDVAQMRDVVEVDCAIHGDVDPTPNDAEAVRDAFAGSDVAVKVRGPDTIEAWLELVPRIAHADVRLIVQLQMPPDPVEAQTNYKQMDRALSAFYG